MGSSVALSGRNRRAPCTRTLPAGAPATDGTWAPLRVRGTGVLGSS